MKSIYAGSVSDFRVWHTKQGWGAGVGGGGWGGDCPARFLKARKQVWSEVKVKLLVLIHQ